MASSILDLSSSLSFYLEKKRDPSGDSHFRWRSIKKFVYLAGTYSSTMFNFDIFSKVCYKIRIFEFVFFEIIIGMTYMFMDSFIKQYTRKLANGKLMNPLLKGITYGLFMQTALWALIHANFLADSLRFMVISLQGVPSWSECLKSSQINSSCTPSSEIIIRCQSDQYTNFNTSSAHYNYIKSFSYLDRSVLTTRLFLIALVWIFNFFLATVTDETHIKIFKLAFVCRSVSTALTVIFIITSTKAQAFRAFLEMWNASAPHSYTSSVEHVAYIYGIGFLGVYDFGTVSPYTMIDNAVVIFTLIFTAIAFLRSWIVRILYLIVTQCVTIDKSISMHYLLFAILPLSTEFLPAHKLYIFYIYLNIMIATSAYLTMLTMTMAKLLHNEFRTIKIFYLVGVLCSVGFGLSIPISLSISSNSRIKGLLTGINVTILYLGSFKVAVVMWVYGVKRFSTDIHYWLGFKPTKFWKICWLVLPVVLAGFLIEKIVRLTRTDLHKSLYALGWIILTVVVVAIINIKTIAKYLVWNNMAGVLTASSKYGPPDRDDRKRRRNFNETIQLRKCKHNCNTLDDMFECNHLPLMDIKRRSSLTVSSAESLTRIFEDPTRTRISSLLETDTHQ